MTDLERELLAAVSVELGWQLLERFATLVRESGTPDEHAAADWIVFVVVSRLTRPVPARHLTPFFGASPGAGGRAE